MKALALLAVLASMALAKINTNLTNSNHALSSGQQQWKKIDDGKWPGKKGDQVYWYKVDDSGKLFWSANGRLWGEVSDGTWIDKSGRSMMIQDGHVVSSEDGENWSDNKDWKWKANDGKWYKLDNQWVLWVER